MTKFLSYYGGQKNIVSRLLQLMPEHRVYVEVFGGSATMLFTKPLAHVNVYNDLDGELVNLFRQIRDKPLELIRKMPAYSRKEWINTRIHFAWVNHAREGKQYKDPVERAARFFFLLSSSFNRIPRAFNTGAYGNLASSYYNKVKAMFFCCSVLQKVTLENRDFRKLIPKHDSEQTLFFLDPPYYDVHYYTYSFKEQDHIDLRYVLHNIKGKFMLTYNKHARIEELYKGCRITIISSRTLVPNKDKTKYFHKQIDHFVIMNYDTRGNIIQW